MSQNEKLGNHCGRHSLQVKQLDTCTCSITASVAGIKASVLINNLNSVTGRHYWAMA